MTIRYSLSSTIDLRCVVHWLNRSEAWHTYQSVVQGSVPHLLQPLTAVTMPEGGIVDRNWRHLRTMQNYIQFCSKLAHRTCRDFHLHTQLRNNGRVKQLTLYFCFAHQTPSLIPRPKQPQHGLLHVSHAGKEGQVTLAMLSCSLQEFVQSQ